MYYKHFCSTEVYVCVCSYACVSVCESCEKKVFIELTFFPYPSEGIVKAVNIH